MGKTSKKSKSSMSDRNKPDTTNNSVKKKGNEFKSKSRIQKSTNLPNKIKQGKESKMKNASTNFLSPAVATVINLKKNGTKNLKSIPRLQTGGISDKRNQNKKFKKSLKNIAYNKDSMGRNEVQKPVNSGKVQFSNSNKIDNTRNAKRRKKGKLGMVDKAGKLELMPPNKVTEQKHQNASTIVAGEKDNSFQKGPINPRLNIKRLGEMLALKQKQANKENQSVKAESLRDRMMARLRASRFRYLNETLYNNQSSESRKYFKNDPDAFTAYHDGYKQQIDQWPLNPLDVIISSIEKTPKSHIIADFGCGEARLASSVTHKVHSFDLVALNDKVTACDMAHTPLLTGSVNVVVFCLSLMGANLSDYIVEANRVLKKDGILKIAEVESRFDQVEDFIKALGDYGFENIWQDLSHNLFYFLDFRKQKDITGKRSKLSPIILKSCLYKKR